MDRQELMKQLSQKISAQKKYKEALNNYDIIYAQFWLETDWKKQLGKKNPTVKDREQWINYREQIHKLKQEIVDLEAEYEMQSNLYDIMMKEKNK